MSGSVEVDPVLLRRAGGLTGDIRDRIGGVLTTLRTTTAGLGEPWGDDKIGTTFAEGPKGYVASRKSALESLDALKATFAGVSEGQNDSADLLEAQERASEDMFR
ncbi:hypothetical protein IU433_17310 [Nocardia puris]|uniref:hypothetical protein n=1 Tax=Nocardia puris TaxID=208602 RepID=UPI00189464D9|nr:hypothetical protein [Nocardia puris]MBF6211568.1 hypothetical protein [Nocardia puris]MBF6366820.1 hypothetical protein [Nocardia puris]MBF6460792.1 hypothetical protein [Nocardia puris]